MAQDILSEIDEALLDLATDPNSGSSFDIEAYKRWKKHGELSWYSKSKIVYGVVSEAIHKHPKEEDKDWYKSWIIAIFGEWPGNRED